MPTAPCNLPGWGHSPWGFAPWGGVHTVATGGPLPTHDPFDIYCAGPCGEISVLLTHPEVIVTPPDDFTVDPVSGDVSIVSNDGSEAHLFIADAPGAAWTLEFTLNATALPADFTNVAAHCLYVGAVDAGPAGLFFSQSGLAYAPTVDAAFQPLPGSDTFFSGDVYYVVRIATSTITGVAYIYVTSLTQYLISGHQLRFVLPVVPYSSTPQTQAIGTHIYVRGTAADTTAMLLDELCLGRGTIIPNLPPVADAGADQAVKFCEIAKLDGSASFDPEGAPLTYVWRLVDAPIGSQFAFSGTDGATFPGSPPTGFTNKFYSSSFNGVIPFTVGDVLLVGGQPFDCIATGSDGHGHYVQTSDVTLPDGFTNVAYTILKQAGLSSTDTVTTTFYPDVLGFFKFDLVVNDATLTSDPRSVVVVNVVESALPRGVIPDLSFLWNYLSDFWKLLEDPERINVFWGSIAQIAATELFTLWQIDYNKSLRDIQRTFNRRWLHYDLLLREPFIQLTANRFIFRGVDSIALDDLGVSVAGEKIAISGANFPTITCTLQGPDPLNPTDIAEQLQASLQASDSRFSVTVVPDATTGMSILRIYAPFSFVIDATTTAVFTPAEANQDLNGTGGVLLGEQIYKVEFSLLGLDVQQNDNLVITVAPPNATPYLQSVRIAAVINSSVDTLRFQRLLLQDPLPLYATGVWAIPSKILSTQLDFWDGLVVFGDVVVYEVTDQTTGIASFYQTVAVAATENQTNTLLYFASPIADFLQDPERFVVAFWGAYRRSYMPIEPLIVDIPYLQRVINAPNDQEVLRRNLDFFITEFRGAACIQFADVWDDPNSGPRVTVPRLWAEYTYLDNRPTIESNFGIPVEFTLDDLSQLPSNVDYLSAVQGLWYAYLHGPTVADLRIGTQILLGLPFSEAEGTITEIRTDFSPNMGQILVQDTGDTAIVRSYSYPNSLLLEVNPTTGVPYVEGDAVQQFAPLVTGVDVVDWVKDPEWFQRYLQQGVFYEVQKYFKFLVTVDSSIFNLSAVLFVRNFLLKIKPTYTYPLFVIREALPESDIVVTDSLNLLVRLKLYMGAIYGFKQTTIGDSPDPSPGRVVSGVVVPWNGLLSSHSVNASDTNTDADYPSNTFPTYSTPDPVIVSGDDRNYMSPAQLITLFASTVYSGGSLTIDGTIFRTGFPAYTGKQYGLGGKYLTDIPRVGIVVGPPATVVGTQTLNCCEIFVEGNYDPTQNTNYAVQIFKNGVLNQTLSFSYASTARSTFLYTSYLSTFTPISVVATDVLSIVVKSTGPADTRVFWNNLFVTLGNGVVLGDLPAGTYTRLAAG